MYVKPKSSSIVVIRSGARRRRPGLQKIYYPNRDSSDVAARRAAIEARIAEIRAVAGGEN